MRFSLPSPALVVACVALLLAAGGVSYAATGSSVNIVDPVTATSKARVSSAGKLYVTDGAGLMSIDGTVTGRPAAPASPWRAYVELQGPGKYIAGPSLSPINVTSLTISTRNPSGSGAGASIWEAYVPSSATSCSGATIPNPTEPLWHIFEMGDGVTPLSFSFPTPLQWRPPSTKKACILATAGGVEITAVTAVGFYGG